MEYKYIYKHHNGAKVFMNEVGHKRIIYEGQVFQTFYEVNVYIRKMKMSKKMNPYHRDRFKGNETQAYQKIKGDF